MATVGQIKDSTSREFKTMTRRAIIQHCRKLLLAGAGLFLLLLAPSSLGFPIGGVTFKDDAPFKGANSSAPLTSADGLLTVAGWLDTNATITASLWQWWWIFGVDDPVTGNPPDNGALLDGEEAITLQFDRAVGASHIAFLYSGGSGGVTNNLARVNISGFLSDPGAYATTYNQQRLFNLTYTNGTLFFDYLWDNGSDYGQLLFSKPAASVGQTLKITGAVSTNGDATSYGLGLFRVDALELYGGPALQPVEVRHNATNTYTTPDGALTVKGYSDREATTPAGLGTYVDQCFGVYGSTNTGAIDIDESATLHFAPGFGLSRLECVYSSGQVTISGFAGDPGFTDLAGGTFGVYADGVLSFELASDRHIYFFTNRAASAGQTLKVLVDPSAVNPNGPFQFAIAGIGYVDLDTLITPDIPGGVATHTTADSLLTLSAYWDTPGTAAASFYANVDWAGVDGGLNREAIDGTESLSMQFAAGVGLSGIGSRYTSGQVIISGFASDPGFSDPSGTATGVSYSDGTLNYTFDQYRAPEVVVNFSNLAASTGRTLWLHTDGGAGSQIALTRVNYAAPPQLVTLDITKAGNNVVLTWPTGTLQQCGAVDGTYTNAVGATSPFTNAISGAQSYFRVKVQ
jgi:hypothetical protein